MTAYRVPSPIPVCFAECVGVYRWTKTNTGLFGLALKAKGEYTAIGPHAALGYGYQARDMGADAIKVIHNGVTLSLEEFEKKWRRV